MLDIITNNLDIWTSTYINKSSTGRGSNGKQEAYGIKKLRELILELAVRGKLLPQDPNDEPASVLLKKISGQREKLQSERKLKKPRKFPKIVDEEKPFELPYGWEWARINDVGHDWGQKTPDIEFTYIDVSAIDNTSGVICEPSVLSASAAPSRARKLVQNGTVIYSTVRPYLKNISVIEEDYSPEPIASTAFAILHPYQDMPGRYFAYYFRSPDFVKYVESVQTGIAYPAINDKQFYGGLIPIPPVSEQHRIVSKVDKLMALCDKLEQQQTDNIEAHKTLLETLLGTLTRVESEEELAEAWNRIAEHFDTLFTTEHSIDQLKQTVLQLAIMGKLVPQYPNDEPASVLLEKITKEYERLTKEGLIKKQKTFSEINENEEPFELPMGWKWERLGKIGLVGSSSRVHQRDWRNSGVPFYRAREIVKLSQYGSVDNELYITEELYESLSSNGLAPENGDMMITGVGTIGTPYIVTKKDKFYFKDASVLIFKNYFKLCPKYLFYFMLGPYWIDTIHSGSMGTTVHTLTISRANEVPVPIPPLAEQFRIVGKVDELMAICDQLESKIKQANETKQKLANAVVQSVAA